MIALNRTPFRCDWLVEYFKSLLEEIILPQGVPRSTNGGYISILGVIEISIIYTCCDWVPLCDEEVGLDALLEELGGLCGNIKLSLYTYSAL